MSGRVALTPPAEMAPVLLTTWKWAVAPVPTRRETKIRSKPATFSSQTTHGTVGLAEFIVPAATRGFSASAVVTLLIEHLDSLAAEATQDPNLFAPVRSRVPWRALPTATQ